MKKIDYPEDCLRIQKVFLDNTYYVTLKKCQKIWKRHSDKVCASWLCLPESDKELWKILKNK